MGSSLVTTQHCSATLGQQLVLPVSLLEGSAGSASGAADTRRFTVSPKFPQMLGHGCSHLENLGGCGVGVGGGGGLVGLVLLPDVRAGLQEFSPGQGLQCGEHPVQFQNKRLAD